MTNPILSMLNQQPNPIQALNNPKQTINQYMQNSHEYQQVMAYIQQNGGDAKNAFYQLAREKGVDPESILAMLRK